MTPESNVIQVLIQLAGAFFAVLTAAMIFDAPRSLRAVCGSIAVLSWGIYLMIRSIGGEPPAVYFSALFIALCAQVLARRAKTPVTVILLPSLFCLVPGIPIYRAVYFLLREEVGLADYNMRLTLLTAGLIALAIFTADFVTRFYLRAGKKIAALRHGAPLKTVDCSDLKTPFFMTSEKKKGGAKASSQGQEQIQKGASIAQSPVSQIVGHAVATQGQPIEATSELIEQTLEQVDAEVVEALPGSDPANDLGRGFMEAGATDAVSLLIAAEEVPYQADALGEADGEPTEGA